MRRIVWPLATGLVVVGLLFIAVFPTRSYLDQRRRTHQVQLELARLEQANQSLDGRVRLLHTPGEIERLARESYNLVRPGEEAYAILPARPVAPTSAPEVTARTRPAHPGQADWWDRAWSGVRTVS